VSLAALVIVFFAAEPVRLLHAQGIMKRAEPIIASIEAFKTKQGAYPDSLAEAKSGNTNPFWYRRWHNIYFLQFRIDGPPFGYIFVYRPDHDYSGKDDYVSDIAPWVDDVGNKIGDWCWFHKM
jgi:hypothetical protein